MTRSFRVRDGVAVVLRGETYRAGDVVSLDSDEPGGVDWLEDNREKLEPIVARGTYADRRMRGGR